MARLGPGTGPHPSPSQGEVLGTATLRSPCLLWLWWGLSLVETEVWGAWAPGRK